MELEDVDAYLTKQLEQKLIDAPRKVPQTKEAIAEIITDIINELVPMPERSLEEIKEGIRIEHIHDEICISMKVPLSVAIAAGKHEE